MSCNPSASAPASSECVSYSPGADSATTRSGRPAAIIAASPASLFGNPSSDFGYATGLWNPGVPSPFDRNGSSWFRSRSTCCATGPSCANVSSMRSSTSPHTRLE